MLENITLIHHVDVKPIKVVEQNHVGVKREIGVNLVDAKHGIIQQAIIITINTLINIAATAFIT